MWINVGERLPENEKEVLVSIERRRSYGLNPETDKEDTKVYKFVALGFYEDGTMLEDDSCYCWNDLDVYEDDLHNYDEDADCYRVPEGWWESTTYNEEFYCIDDKVVAWMELPKPYGEK